MASANSTLRHGDAAGGFQEAVASSDEWAEDPVIFSEKELRGMRKALTCGLIAAGVLFAFQRPFREMNGIEYSIGSIPIPPDAVRYTEWAFARLMFPPGPLNGYRGARSRLAYRRFAVVAGFSAGGPAFLAGSAAADADPRARGRADRQPGRGRRVRLAVALCRPGRANGG